MIKTNKQTNNTITNQTDTYVTTHFWENRIAKQTVNIYTEHTKTCDDTVTGHTRNYKLNKQEHKRSEDTITYQTSIIQHTHV